MPEPTPAELTAEERIKEAGQPTLWDVAFREGERSRDREIAELRDELTKARQGIAAPVPPPAGVRDQIAEAIRAAACTGDCGKTEEECARERIQPFVWHHGKLAVVEGTPEQFADVVLRVPAIAEALTAAAAVERVRQLAAVWLDAPDPLAQAMARDLLTHLPPTA